MKRDTPAPLGFVRFFLRFFRLVPCVRFALCFVASILIAGSASAAGSAWEAFPPFPASATGRTQRMVTAWPSGLGYQRWLPGMDAHR